MEKDEHNMELPKTWCGKLIVNLVWQIGNTTTEKQDHVLVTKEILPTLFPFPGYNGIRKLILLSRGSC